MYFCGNIAFAVCILHILCASVECTEFSTRLEYKEVNNVPEELRPKLDPFKLMGRKYYYIANDELNWYGAAHECRRFGGNLVNLISLNELQLVGLQLDKTQNYWIDMNNLGQTEFYSIATGSKAVYEKWMYEGDNEVEENANANCVALQYDDQDDFVMKKTQCLEKAKFICQLFSPRTISMLVW